MMQRVTFLVGGASSGKSNLAERWAVATGLPRLYLATAEAQDAEMERKIRAHQQKRDKNWRVETAPLALSEALNSGDHEGVTLLDGITLWLSNIMHTDDDFAPRIDALLDEIARHPGPLIIVSDEVGLGLVPDTPLGRLYRDALGKLNQQIAARADCVVGVMAGLPFALKGPLPDG